MGLRGARPVKEVRRDLGLVREIRSFVEEEDGEDGNTGKRNEEETEGEWEGKAERKEAMDHLLLLVVAITETDAIVVCVEQHEKCHHTH